MQRLRLLVIANSQGAPSGLGGMDRYLSYPLQIQTLLPGVDCTVWAMSSLSVETVNAQFPEVVLQHRPNIVILQCGVIEGCPRILPKRLRGVLEHFGFGRALTGPLHSHRAAWIRFLNRFGVQFCDMPISEFKVHLGSVQAKCSAEGIQLVFVRIPMLSEEFDRGVVPRAIETMARYDVALVEVADRLGTPVVDVLRNATDPTRNSLYFHGTVHFSVAGHTLIAQNLVAFLTSAKFAARTKNALGTHQGDPTAAQDEPRAP